MKRIAVALVALLALVGVVSCSPPPSAPPLPPVPGNGPVVAAFKYDWCPENCSQSNFHPPAYDSSSEATLRFQDRELNEAGVQAIVTSWFPGQHQDSVRLPLELQSIKDEGLNLRFAPYYESEGAGAVPTTQIQADFAQLEQWRQTNPNSWLVINGRPVVFVYGNGAEDCTYPQRYAPLRSHWYVVLKVFAGYASCSSQPDEWHQYGPAVREDRQGSHSVSISPGFWKVGEAAPRLPRDLTAWRTALADAHASGAHLQLITTFNEWVEGTGIEPTSDDNGAYLQAVKDQYMGGTPTTTTTQPPSTTTTTTAPPSGGLCVGASTKVTKVVEVWMENKTYSSVIGPAPYQTGLAHQCATFTNFAVNGSPSEPNYLAATFGSTFGVTDDGSHPQTADNIWRQVRTAGGVAREYHDGATAPCQVGANNAEKHEPRMFAVGGNDASLCSTEVLPLSSFDPNNLPTYSFVTPDLCHDTHDCSVATGDAWLKGFLPPVLNSTDYQSGRLLVELVYDEYTPLPNVFLNRDVPAGVSSATAVSHFSELRLNEELLGLPLLGSAASAPDMRSTLHL